MNEGGPGAVLLVEDDAVIALSQSAILRRNGFRVLTAGSAEKAFAVLEKETVRLILMDIDLGKGRMNGTDAAEHILKRYDLPIVFCTSHNEKEMVEKVKGITRYGYVLKNAGEFVLVEGITMALELFEVHTKLKKEIEERKRAEQALRENEERLRIINELGSDYAYCHALKEDGSLEPVWHIGSFDHITGYTPEELYEKGGWGALIHPDDIPGAGEYVRKLFSGEKAEFTARIVTKSGDVRWIHDSGRPWLDEKSGVIIGTMGSAREITSRMLIEQELKAIYEHTPLLMLLLDEDKKICKANSFAEGLTGLRTGEALACVHHLDDPAGCGFGPSCASCGIRRIITETLETGREFSRAEVRLDKDVKQGAVEEGAAETTFLVSTALLYRGKARRCLISFEDVSELKRSEQRARALLAEKELILKEAHHRIKNNMDVVRSLLTLHPESHELAAGTVQAMMVLYDRLYRSSDSDALSVKEYLPPLVRDIAAIFEPTRTVECGVDIQDIVLSSRELSALGIIVNELISNSMKYAFGPETAVDGRPAGSITVALHGDETGYTLRYGDSGAGFPPNMERKSGGFGMQLVELAAAQIGGSVEIASGAPARIEIRFIRG